MDGNIIRVAIAGQGRSGFDIHARWLRQAPGQFRIVAVADQLPKRRAQAKKELGARTFSDWKDLLAYRDFDLFVNALPSCLHAPVTVTALEAGCNVVCEKPLAVKVSDFDRMTAAARKGGGLFAPFQNSRFNPFFIKMQEVLASGVLGELLHARLSYSGFARRWDWQTRQELGGGNINNTGPHPLDHAVMLFGNRTPKVFSRLVCGPNSSGDADDFALVVLHGKAAPTIEVLVSSYQAYPQGDTYSLNCTLGGMTGGGGGLKWKSYNPRKNPRPQLMKAWSLDRKYCHEPLDWTEETWTPPNTGLDSFQTISKGFYDSVHNALVKGAPLVVKPEQVRRQVAVLEACHSQNPLPKRR